MSREDFAAAKRLFGEAIDLDSSVAHGGLALADQLESGAAGIGAG